MDRRTFTYGSFQLCFASFVLPALFCRLCFAGFVLPALFTGIDLPARCIGLIYRPDVVV